MRAELPPAQRAGKPPCPLLVAVASGLENRRDRKELCIKTLYVRDRLCQQPLSCVRNASRRRRRRRRLAAAAVAALLLARDAGSLTLVATSRMPGATRQGGCCRIVLPYKRPPRRHHHRATTSIVISRGSVAGDRSLRDSLSLSLAECVADSETRYPAGAASFHNSSGMSRSNEIAKKRDGVSGYLNGDVTSIARKVDLLNDHVTPSDHIRVQGRAL